MRERNYDIGKYGSKSKTDLMTTLYNDYYRALVGFAMQITADEESAADIVQSVFQKVWEKDIALDSHSQVKAYLYNSVRNQSINHVKHRHAEANYVQVLSRQIEEFHVSADGNEDFYTEEIYRQLFLRIDELPRRQREVFLLCMEGKTLKEIGEALNISRETVKQRKRKALDILRSQLSGKEYILLLILIN